MGPLHSYIPRARRVVYDPEGDFIGTLVRPEFGDDRRETGEFPFPWPDRNDHPEHGRKPNNRTSADRVSAPAAPRRPGPAAKLKLTLAAQLVWLTRSERVPNRVRFPILRALGLEIADDVELRDSVYFSEYRTQLAEGAFVGPFCYFDDHSPVTFGRNAGAGAHCKFLTASHEIGSAEARIGPWFTKPIVVGEGCWIAAGVTVLPGVSIGAGCVVAAGSLVREDCAPNGFYAGVPAVRKRDLPG